MRGEAGSLQRVSTGYDLTVVLFSFFWNVKRQLIGNFVSSYTRKFWNRRVFQKQLGSLKAVLLYGVCKP